MVMNDIIKVEDLGFGYPNKEVLKGINLTISNNELVKPKIAPVLIPFVVSLGFWLIAKCAR